ncbi:Saccharopine dehydrogenase-domain-containing protein [Chiua virens]|nr:Saccharopine dehydrogenase-domain-containing protein [Chiua virens]
MLDILLLGYTGRLITRYLATHPQRTAFSFGLAARSQSKLKALVREHATLADVPTFVVDITNTDDVDKVVQRAQVIINAVGPYWYYGTPVVRACVRHEKHYVDLTGEAPWVRDIIFEFDYRASCCGSVIVPCAGLDSVPSDILAYLGNKTLKEFGGPSTTVCMSTSAWELHGTGISGGTFSSMLAHLEEIPKNKLEAAREDFALSPVQGVRSPQPRAFYSLPISNPPIQGALYPMAIVNLQVVQRSWGLFELATRSPGLVVTTSPQSGGKHEGTTKLSYGPQFKYEEFLALPSRLHSLLVVLFLVTVVQALRLFPPARWIARMIMPQSGEGPNEEQLEAGALKITNITTSLSLPNAQGRRTTVRTILRGKGDPGYLLASIMIAECALSLVLETDRLPAFAKRGGVLTPMTAFGDVLIERLKASGRIAIESEIILADANRKKL